jgi:hypothetical protein
MKRVFIIIGFILFTVSVKAQHFEVDTISKTGPLDQRINMVFLSDGYLQEDLDKFIRDVHWMMDALLAKSPYSYYRNYFNCFAIKVPSEVSGAANDPDSLINNYFGSTFNYAKIWRLVVPVRTDRISSVLANNFPAYDQVFVIVNDDRYGGSGGWVATSTTHPDGPEICIHELGHSFGGLSDEYWAGDMYARENYNLTQVSDTSKVKWKRWLGYNSTGVYPHEEAPTWFRPHQHCEMRYLNSSFCSVCKEQIAGRILALTNPVLGFSPQGGSPVITSDTVFRVDLLTPTPNTLKTWWELNRNEIAAQTDNIRLSVASLNPGSNNLTCFILDTTGFIRDPNHPSLHLNKVTWTINYSPSGIDYLAVSDKVSVTVYPNPASDHITLTYRSERQTTGSLKVKLVDSSGKQVTRPVSFPLDGLTGKYPIPLPNRQLKAGIYYLLVQSPDHLFSLPVVIGQNGF